MEEEEDTKRLDTIDDLKDEEIIEEDSEITEEIIEEVEEEEEPKIKEEIIEEVEEEEEPKIIKKDVKPKSKKKTIIIISIAISILIICLIITILLLNKNKDPDIISKDPFINNINKNLKNGTLSREVKKALKENSLDTNKVYLISLDIDSDKEQELIAYASDEENNYLLNFDVDEDISYEESYELDSKESLIYSYSINDNKAYWVTINKDNYAIISDTVKIINKEDYTNNYYDITNKYNNDYILDNTIKYYLGKQLDLEDLEDNQFTNKELLKDNSISLDKIKEKAIKYKEEINNKEKEELEKQKMEQEEKVKKKMEEDAKKNTSSNLKVGSYTYNFGTYNIVNTDGTIAGTLELNSDYSCVHLGNYCTYTIDENIDVTEDPEQPASIAGIVLSDGQKYIVSKYTNQFTDLSGLIIVKYKG